MMKSSADKTSTTASAQPQAANQPFFRKAGEGGFFPAPAVQLKMTVNAAGDRFEQEADRSADRVMRAEATGPAGERKEQAQLQRKDNGGAPAIDAKTESAIGNKTSGGQPLAPDVRRVMEERFGADFGAVRIHADAEAGGLSNRLAARAFTYRNHIFFGHGQYQPGTSDGKRLLAHELTHTIQQGHAVQRSPRMAVSSGAPAIQRFGIQDALDYFADAANNVPGFRMLCIVLGFNPVNGRRTDRSAANILRALVELIPGGALIARALDSHGLFERAGAWVEGQLATLGNIGADITAGLRRFVDSLGLSDILDLDGVWERAKSIFLNPIGRLIAFGANAVTGLMRLVREAILRPLARLAEGTAGYDLLKAVLGQDPITGDPVPRTAATLIGGFMKLIGQEEVWLNIQRGNAVGRAWTWFQGALSGLMAFARAIPGRIVEAIASITWQDVITIAGAFIKVGRAFLNIAGEFISWAGAQVIGLLEIIFSVVAPGAVPYIGRARGAFRTIIQNPVAFVGNLVRAGRMGFNRFAANIGTHLRTALIRWITGPLGAAGVYIPRSFDLSEIVRLVLSVLGLTWQNIRAKLVRIIPEPVLQALERTAGILVTLVREGPAAAWRQIVAELTELKDTMIAQVTEMITTQVVRMAVVRVVSMLNPAGAVIQAIIATYNTIMFFIEKINQIAAVVGSFIDSIAEIASGQVDSAARKVEATMANTLPLIIGFLARLVGLGSIPERLVAIIRRIRQPIDRGLDRIVAWLGTMLARARQAVASVVNWWRARLGFRNAAGESHTLSFAGEEDAAVLTIESTPRPLVAYLADYEATQNPDAAKRIVIASIRAEARTVDDIKSNYGARRGRAQFTEADGNLIRAALLRIVALLAQLGGSAAPPTMVRWDPSPNGEDGDHMVAEPLSLNPGAFAGSSPREESRLWNRVRTLFPGQYVRGHLLNHHVHGEGTKRNLAPITIGANNRMERIAETQVKGLVLNQRKTVRYEVTMERNHTYDPRYPELVELPSRVIMKYAEMLPAPGGGWARGPGEVTETVSSPLPPLP